MTAAQPQSCFTATVVVCAYLDERWPLLNRCIRSLFEQTVLPDEIIVCVDHNPGLFALARLHFAGSVRPSVRVVENRYRGRLGSARTTAAEIARGDICVFLDDDAYAEPRWLELMLAPYSQPSVVAVGGAPLPEYSRPRPQWLPFEFDWVFGCAYVGLPTTRQPTRRLIGAAMSVRRDALNEIGGFHSDNHDDMDMCHRLATRWPQKVILFEPAATVHHFVPPERLTWRYFWRRCFFVNRGKAHAHRQLDSDGNLAADRAFVMSTIRSAAVREGPRAVRGDIGAALRLFAVIVGIVLAALGYAVGRYERSAPFAKISTRRRA